jgi:hypothetical protein
MTRERERHDAGAGHADDARIDDAIVAYVGAGRAPFPTADADAVRALIPEDAGVAVESVRRAVALSDAIALDEIAPFDDGLRGRLLARLRELQPERGPAAIEALGWRWGFLNLR